MSLRPVTIQLAGKFEQYQGLLTDARTDYYSQFSELYDCMVAEERWAPVAERGRFQSALDRVSSPFKSPRITRELIQTRMTREQIQKLPPEVIHSIWWDLADIQASWLDRRAIELSIESRSSLPTSDGVLNQKSG